MFDFIFSILTQSITFLPLALGISVSYHLMRATDMTLDGSFVLGAAVFAYFVTQGYSPFIAAPLALLVSALGGILTAFIQRGGRVDPLLAGVLATFILSSLNLIIMGKPNINLLSQPSLIAFAFEKSEVLGCLVTAAYTTLLCGMAYCLMRSYIGLTLRAFG